MITELSVISLAPHQLHQIEWIIYSNGLACRFRTHVDDVALNVRYTVTESAAALRLRRDMGVAA